MNQAEQEEVALVEAAEKAERERTAELDRLYPRGEPDEEGIDLHPKDPRRRFIATCEGVTFYNAGPITEEEKAEADAIWEAMTGGNYSPGEKKEEKKEAKTSRKSKA